jgi:ankyrin repeat protein
MPRWATLLLAVLFAAPACDLFPYFGVDDIHEELTRAARRGDAHTIEVIAAKGVDLDQPYQSDRSGLTPLQHAIQKGRVEAVRILLEWGADPDATQGSNEPPLVMAREANSQTLVTLLINAGATPTDAFAEKPATPARSRP